MSFSPSNALRAARDAALSMDGLASTIHVGEAGSFAALGPAFLTRLPATPVPDPYLVAISHEMAESLGFDAELAESDEAAAFAAYFAGNPTREWPADALPYATAYSGHQFGVWAGQLGDGRALTFGEVQRNAARLEVQLKGTGRTPYSRMGDGRAVLRSSIREFLCSEAMHHLGIPTTRALAIIGSDLPVRRESIETAAIVTRVAPSFVRFGHFEHFYSNDRTNDLRALADHVIDRFYPHCREADDPYLALLDQALRTTADLMAEWQGVGFCHGVMNTDNMSILGLTIDYGPFGFVNGFNAHHICNHSDTQGRYAYSRQPQVGYWNLFCLAQALVPLFGNNLPEEGRSERVVEEAQKVMERYKTYFAPALEAKMRAKLGLEVAREEDIALANNLFEVMHANRADFTLTFRNLAKIAKADSSRDAPVRDLFLDRAAFDAWAVRYRERLAQETRDDDARAEAMNRVNPKYVLRNHLAEQAIRQAAGKDFSEVARLLDVLRHPYDEQPHYEAYTDLPPDWAGDLEVSCSS
ncbi:Selenoprotein O and cysteine-containing [Candidatus Paraburkholderia calva]|nr:Selenoprotein O and cysteine-containing [Candidatus Paraburkholderia calva]